MSYVYFRNCTLYTQPLGGDSEIVGGNSKNITNIKQKITNI